MPHHSQKIMISRNVYINCFLFPTVPLPTLQYMKSIVRAKIFSGHVTELALPMMISDEILHVSSGETDFLFIYLFIFT